MPFYDLLAFFAGLGEIGRRLMAWYGQIAALIFLIALLEAWVFGFRHFLMIRDVKHGWKHRIAPKGLAESTQNSGIMRVGEPVLVSLATIALGFLVALVWPFWLPFVGSVVIYDVGQYLIRRWKRWRGITDSSSSSGDDDGEEGSFRHGHSRRKNKKRRRRSDQENSKT